MYTSEAGAMALLPFPFWFAELKRNRIAVLPEPRRNPGILQLSGPPKNPAAGVFAEFVSESARSVQQLIRRHESAVV